MLRRITISLLTLSLATPALAEDGFNPLRIARDAANLGLETARKAIDLGFGTAEEAAEIAEDAVTVDDSCPKGERYRDRNGRWHTCD